MLSGCSEFSNYHYTYMKIQEYGAFMLLHLFALYKKINRNLFCKSLTYSYLCICYLPMMTGRHTEVCGVLGQSTTY